MASVLLYGGNVMLLGAFIFVFLFGIYIGYTLRSHEEAREMLGVIDEIKFKIGEKRSNVIKIPIFKKDE